MSTIKLTGEMTKNEYIATPPCALCYKKYFPEANLLEELLYKIEELIKQIN